MRIGGVLADLAVTRAFAIFVRQENAREPARKFVSDLLERRYIS